MDMELKLSVNIGATLQVKNAKGEWDWIKPEVGAEINIPAPTEETPIQEIFANLWDNVVGPQFKSVVTELVADQSTPTAPIEALPEDEVYD